MIDCPSSAVRGCVRSILPNHVYVIPPNKDLTILNGRLHLMELSQPRGVNLPIDTFLRSLEGIW